MKSININIKPLKVNNTNMIEEIEYLKSEVNELIEALKSGTDEEAMSEMFDVIQVAVGLITQYKKCSRYEIEVANIRHHFKIDKYIETKKHDFEYQNK